MDEIEILKLAVAAVVGSVSTGGLLIWRGGRWSEGIERQLLSVTSGLESAKTEEDRVHRVITDGLNDINHNIASLVKEGRGFESRLVRLETRLFNGDKK